MSHAPRTVALRVLWLLVVFMAPGVLVRAQTRADPNRLRLLDRRFVPPQPAEHRHQLPNGLVAYVVEDDVVPLVTLRAFIKVGRIDDGPPGAAEALANAIRHFGPRDSTPAEFNDSLVRMAADYMVDLHDEWMELSLNVPAEDFLEALDLLARTLQAPHVSRGAIDGARAAAVSAASLRGPHAEEGLYTGSRDVAVELFRERLYADHPYGQRPTPRELRVAVGVGRGVVSPLSSHPEQHHPRCVGRHR